MRIMLSLLPGPILIAGAVAFYLKTDFIFPHAGWLNSNTGKYYLPAAVLLMSCILITLIALYLRHKKPETGNRAFSLYVFLPIIAFIVFSDWTSTLLVILFLATLIALSQMPVFRSLAGDTEEKMKIPGVPGLSGFQAILLLIMIVAGILLFITARSWAYTNRQLADIKARGLYAEITDIETLREDLRIEYARITDPGLTFGYQRTKKFGSGSDAYTVVYAMLVNGKNADRGLAEWPFWYYCGSHACKLKQPLYVAIDRCDDGTECPADFRTVLRLAFEEKFGAQKVAYPPGLRLLSDAEDLGNTEEDWRAKIRCRLILLAAAQLLYTAVYATLAFRLRKFS